MHQPYRDADANQLYHALFCDDLEPVTPAPGEAAAPWQRALMAGPAFTGSLRRLVEDPSGDARVRALACHRLRELGHVVHPRRLFGVVIEVPRHGGLDTLAVYADGGLRLLRGQGTLTLAEAGNERERQAAQAVLEAGNQVVHGPGVAPQPRSAPSLQAARVTFIASDGLYAHQDTLERLRVHPQAAAVLHAAQGLLHALADTELPVAA